MDNPEGSFVWYELMTPDPDRAAAFYGAVVGWTIDAHSDPDAAAVDYRHIRRVDGGDVGGVLRLTPVMRANGAQPSWAPYLFVQDVAHKVWEIESEGGKALTPTTTINAGTFAMVCDPQGVPFYLMNPRPPVGAESGASDAFDPAKPQHVRWNELTSPEQSLSLDFYHRHFGFEFKDKMSMGPMGDYWFIGHHGRTLGAVRQRQSADEPAQWLMYFGVGSIATARETVESRGGRVVMGPQEIPGGEHIIVAIDPEGAQFGLVGPAGG